MLMFLLATRDVEASHNDEGHVRQRQEKCSRKDPLPSVLH